MWQIVAISGEIEDKSQEITEKRSEIQKIKMYIVQIKVGQRIMITMGSQVTKDLE